MHLAHGKSTSYIIPNALKIADQEIMIKKIEEMGLQGKNIVCTDPKRRTF